MKNVIAISVLACGMFASAGAFAQANSPGKLEQSGPIIMADCMKDPATNGSQLTNDVNVTMSAKVKGAYLCNVTSTSTGANPIHIGTCSTAGSVKSRTIPCAVTGTDANGAPTYNDSSCTGTAGSFTGIGPSAFTANSAGGQVVPNFLGTTAATTCTTDAILSTLNTIAAK